MLGSPKKRGGIVRKAVAVIRKSHRQQEVVEESEVNDITSNTYARLLVECGNAGALEQGKRVHAKIIKNGLDGDAYLGNNLMRMYGKFGSLDDALDSFQRIQLPNVVSWSTLISVYVEQRKFSEARVLFRRMQLHGIQPNNVSFINILKAFQNRLDLAESRLVHLQIKESGYECDTVVSTSLINMYGKCGSVEDARKLFDDMPFLGVMSWTAMIAAYVSNGKCDEAMYIFRKMLCEGVTPDVITFVNAMNACVRPEALKAANVIYACITEDDECYGDVTLGNAVMTMHGKCGNAEYAEAMFQSMQQKNVVSWNVMIRIYFQHKKFNQALLTFRKMLQDGTLPNKITYTAAISASEELADLEAIVYCVDESLVEVDVVLQTILVNKYAQFGCVDEARIVFEDMPHKDLVLWNVMIAAFVDREEAYRFFRQMQLEGVHPDKITFVNILNCNAFTCRSFLPEIDLICSCISDMELKRDTILCNSIISMYVKCGRLEAAHRIFLYSRDVISWNTMIGGYAEHGRCTEAVGLYQQMQLEGRKSDRVTFMGVLNACAYRMLLREGKLIHEQIVESGMETIPSIANSIISMYERCGSLIDAQKAFDKMHNHDDVVSWTALISAYAQQEDAKESLVCFARMLLEGVVPSKVTLVAMLNLCATASSIADGKLIHRHVEELGFQDDDVVLGTALVNMYAECKVVDKAFELFDKLGSLRDVISWNSMISSCAQHLNSKQLLRLFHHILHDGTKPTRITFATIFDALADSAAVSLARVIQTCAAEAGLLYDVSVGNGVVNLYGKCGNLVEAFAMFERICVRNTTSWNTMITAYAQHGHADQVVDTFIKMQHEGVDPSNVTFVNLFTSCSRAGLLEEACRHYYDMERDFQVVASEGEYGCIVDLLGRAGRLGEAEEFIMTVPPQICPTNVLWSTLLSACKMHGDVDRGKRAAQHVLRLQPENSSGYVALSSMMKTDNPLDWDMLEDAVVPKGELLLCQNRN